MSYYCTTRPQLLPRTLLPSLNVAVLLATGPVTAQFTMSENDLNNLKLKQNLGTNPANTFIEILPGNMLYDSGATMEWSATSGISAIAASTVSRREKTKS